MLPTGQGSILQKERENNRETFFLGKYILSGILARDTTSFLDFRITAQLKQERCICYALFENVCDLEVRWHIRAMPSWFQHSSQRS